MEGAEADALAYLDFPEVHRRRIRTNNMQERTNREVKRRARVLQSFPSEEALIRPAGAVCCEASEDWSSAGTWTSPRSRGYGRGGSACARPHGRAGLEGENA